VAKEWGASGLAYLVYDEEGQVRSPIVKFLSEAELREFEAGPASTVLFAAGEPALVSRVLGGLRTHLGRELGLPDESWDQLLWVIDFPLFEWDEEEQRWTFSHHPFTGVAPGHEDLIESDPGAVLSQAYDLVWNGWELGSGSIRIHRQDVQQRVFRALGLSEEEAREKFGFLLEALEMGAPPHGGFALGLDRFIALLAGEPNIREVTAFPKVASGADPLTGAPSEVPPEQLAELHLRVVRDDA
jgi:aspartyl-tRNA synthetase